MSKISNLIFDGGTHYMTSPFGLRTLNGKKSEHSGTDYGTKNKKIPQYAIEDGYVFSSAKSNSDGGKYVWVVYPRVKKAFLHYHLDKYIATSKQGVKKGTLLGYTGMTGYATGVHLHLGVRDLKKLTSNQVNNLTWNLLRSCAYIDPEKYSTTYTANPYKEPTRAITKGDVGEDVKWVQWELVRLGYSIGNAGVDGRCGPITTEAIKKFQREHKDLNGKQLLADGFAGPLTRGAMENA